jgi:hypothetical protein
MPHQMNTGTISGFHPREVYIISQVSRSTCRVRQIPSPPGRLPMKDDMAYLRCDGAAIVLHTAYESTAQTPETFGKDAS